MISKVAGFAGALPPMRGATDHGALDRGLGQCRPSLKSLAVRAQLLDAERPTGLLELVRHLGMLQLDPIAAVAPSADLVAWSRLGSAYFPAKLRERLEDR